MKTIKKDLKVQGKRIRELKNIINYAMVHSRATVGIVQIETLEAIKHFRYEHLAYCILRGQSYEAMERTTRENNIIDKDELNKTIKKMEIDVQKRKEGVKS